MKYVLLIVAVFNYLMAILGAVTFGKNDPFHFGSLGRALISVYKVGL